MLNFRNTILSKIFSYLFAVVLVVQICSVAVLAENDAMDLKQDNTKLQSSSESISYNEYLEKYESYGANTIDISIKDIIKFDNALIQEDSVRFEKDGSFVTFNVAVQEAGLYNIWLEYSAVADLGKAMQIAVEINGKSPYTEASRIVLEQIWSDKLIEDGSFKTDANGNDILPEVEQLEIKNTTSLFDNEGYYSAPLMFYFENGTNTLTIKSSGDAFNLYNIMLTAPEKYIGYSEYKKNTANLEDNVKNDYSLVIQAEHPSKKSDSSLYAAVDKSDPLIEPISSTGNKRNVIGTNNWKNPGQYLEWDFKVPEDGYYKLGFKYRQSANRGLENLRKLSIDGKVPFSEALNIGFEYSDGYEILVPGNGKEDYLFYLTEGSHTIRLEVTLGEISDTLMRVEAARKQLSDLVQRIMMITSVNPDLYRDYYLDEQIPTLVSELNEVADILKQEMQNYAQKTGQKNSNATTLEESADQLQKFADKTYLIPEKLSSLSGIVSSLATWINGQREQLIELDYIVVSSPNKEMPKAKASFFSKLFHEIKMTLYSYAKDYSVVDVDKDSVEVWVSGGRDQRDILKELVNTADFDFNVNLKLVAASVTNAIMAGIGPDVVLNLAHTEPVNLGMRGALQPLQDYEGFDELKNQFSKEAFLPYQLEGNVYGLPETETFNVLFIRTDIFAKLGLSVPKTWDEFFSVNRILQQNKMEAGLPGNFYATLIYQNGGSYFNDDLTALNLEDGVAFSAFQKWVELYNEYSFSLFKEDYNRFRSGEMPMMISSYALYNKIYAAAPEIRNDWNMYMVPGSLQEDGTVNLTNVGDTSGTASVMLADAKNKEAAWKFLKWWAGSNTQSAFGNRIEYIMGVAGRYTTANQEAFKKLAWSSGELNTLMSQWNYVCQIPEVPGGYYVTRNIDNAFRACTTRKENTKETFTYWMQETNNEITRKREQYIKD